MSGTYAFRMLSVFSSTAFGGNPLCVFENASDLTDEQMLNITRQLNLSEVAFLYPSKFPRYRLRIFTADQELPFAGYPILGSAYVLKSLQCTKSCLEIECGTSLVKVEISDGILRFQSPLFEVIPISEEEKNTCSLSALFNLNVNNIVDCPVIVDAPSPQLLICVDSIDALENASVQYGLLQEWPVNSLGRRTAYIFTVSQDSGNAIFSRHFFLRADGCVVEEAATGSACASLGSWFFSKHKEYPRSWLVKQGLPSKRVGNLHLELNLAERNVYVGGGVVEVGRGLFLI
jgi:PhzF family phenazine biosynthesis protein